MNNVVLVGRLTRDPEKRVTQTGKSVLSFTCAVDRRFKTQEQTADFINCVAWNQSADFLDRYAKKGTLISLSGRIETGSYDHKDGYRVYTTEVVADQVSILGGGVSSERSEQPSGNYTQSRGQTYYPDESPTDLDEDFGGPTLDISSDDLPF